MSKWSSRKNSSESLKPSQMSFSWPLGNGVSCALLSVFLMQCQPASRPQPIAAYEPASGFTLLSDVAPSIQQDIRYATANNFLGRPVNGYFVNACVISEAAAQALANVQQQAVDLGYSLKVYDCYRPQHAVDDFVRWSSDADDNLMQSRFFPSLQKDQLFPQGYIAARSGHSRGSTVDLTLVPLDTRQPSASPLDGQYDCRGSVMQRFPDNSIDMGTGYDCFDEKSHTDNPEVTATVRANRDLLRDLMEQSGFENYSQEWWHFTLNDEPFPERYFDFSLPH